MSIFNELLLKLFEISNLRTSNFDSGLKDALQSFDKFEEEFQKHNGHSKAREKTQKDKSAMITLQSIDEGEDEQKEGPNPPALSKQKRTSKTRSDSQSSGDSKKQGSKKRSKNEVDDMSSPEQDKRVKRNASVKAQSIISKQVNVNLNQKLRRENSVDIPQPVRQSSRSRRHKDDEKENLAPQEIYTIQIKQEKLSVVPIPDQMEMENLTLNSEPLPTDVEIKQEMHKDDIAMPPPAAPVPKPRKGAVKEKPKEKSQDETSEEQPTRRSVRAARNMRQMDSIASARESRSARSSSRARDAEHAAPAPAPAPAPEPEPRPKRTRGRKKLSELRTDSGNATHSSAESLPASPAEKPRPKRTRRAQKADKEEPKPTEPESKPIEPEPKPIEPEPQAIEPQPTISPKEERPSVEQEHISSPILPLKEIKPKNRKEKAYTEDLLKTKQLTKTNSADKDLTNNNNVDKNLGNTKITEDSTLKKDKELPKSQNVDTELTKSKSDDRNLAKTKHNGLVIPGVDQPDNMTLDETRTITKDTEMDQTVVLTNGVYNHALVTPKHIHLNETVVLDKTMLLNKPNGVMDATVVLDKGPVPSNVSEDDSLITDDSDSAHDIANTPPNKGIPAAHPLSAVKEKVQQFEEMASRVTRTKTRAMAKKEEETGTETQTPPDKVSKALLSSDTLNKMNNLIFNGKTPQVSSSACKARATIPTKQATASASKALAINKAREAAEETMKREDARQKKEALLEAKREQQKRKREEKMAAAAAARSQAERERRALLEAAARDRHEKQHHADMERSRQLKEAERKRQELARKVAETEERRKAEEAARQQRLAEEQRRAMEQRNKKNEELEAMRREEARMAKEIEKKQREYIEKQKKQKIDKMHTPFKTALTPLGKYQPALPPVYMEDGFQYLNSDEDADPPERPVPAWSSCKARRHRLGVQKRLRRPVVEEWFRVGVHSPDLTEIFPSIERARLKRTSSAVWHTPPPLPPHRD